MMKFRAFLGFFVIAILLTACVAAEAAVPTPHPTASPTTAAPTASPTPAPTATQTPIPSTATPTPVPTLRAIAGNFSNQMARLEQHAPAAKSNLFVVPTQSEMKDLAALWQAMTNGKAAENISLAERDGFELLTYTDKAFDGSKSILLREKKPIRRGWGLYARRTAPQNTLIIEVPHPIFDTGTPAVGLDAYRALNAAALLVAGSHRHANADGSADAAHSPQTVFQAIHAAATADSSAVVLQIHGFAAANHPGYPQIVLGGNQSPASETLAASLAETLQKAGLSVGVCEAGQWKKLCGTRNLQGDTMPGGTFLHIELDESVRENDAVFIAALRSYGQK